ncbi:MAG: T9SS type A sorting domain-containing protein [Bacteroidota bacterium]
MRKICLLLLCLLLAGLIHAQSAYFERNYQSFFNNNLIQLRGDATGGVILFEQSDPTLYQVTYGFNRVDSTGVSQFFSFLSGQTQDFDFLPIQDGYIVAYLAFDCDYWLPRMIKRYDFQGNLIWEVPLETQSTYHRLLPGPDSSFWVVNGVELPVRFDLNGNLLGYGSDLLKSMDHYVERSNGKLLTYGPLGVNQYNKSLSTIQSTNLDFEVLKADTLSENRTAVLTSHKLYILDAAFDVIKVIDHNLFGLGIKDMATDGNYIRVLTGNTNPAIRVYDADLQLIATQNLPANDPFRPKFMCIQHNRLILAGNSKPFNQLNNSQVISVRSLPIDQPAYGATTDALVTNIMMQAAPIATHFPGTQGGIIQASDVKVTIQNAGDAVLNSVTLNAVIAYDSYLCGPYETTYKQQFPAVNLLPGDSITLSVGDLTATYASWVPPVYHLCFWTTLPNDSLDRNTLNDQICKDFTTIVGTKNPETPYPLVVFPNPAAGDFQIVLPVSTTLATVQLFDLTGRAVLKTSASGSGITVNAAGLARGLYQVSVRDEKGNRYIGKVVLE